MNNCILICTNGNDLDLVECLISSIRDNYKNHPDIVLVADTIISLSIDVGDIKIITIPRVHSTIEVSSKLNMSIHNEVFRDATLLRFRGLDYLVTTYDKILYLDTDTIVLDDVSELFDLEYGLSAALDYNFASFVLPPTDGSTYFNAGVMLITAKLYKELGIASLYESYESTGVFYELYDQDYLNSICSEVNILPQQYNYVPIDRLLYDAKIMHFCHIKPWLQPAKFGIEALGVLVRYLCPSSDKYEPIKTRYDNLCLLKQVNNIGSLL